MADNNPTIWEEAYWNSPDALNLPVNVNPNVNGTGNANANGVASDVLQMDDGINPPTSTTAATTNIGSARSNGSIHSGSSNTTSNEMYLLYTAPGYRG